MSEKVSIFDLNNENLHREEVTSGGGDYFKPSYKNGTNGVYSAVVRFIPYVEDPENSLVDVWRVWLEDPLTNEKKYVILPPKPEKNVITEAFFKLRSSESVAEQKLKDNFSSSKSYSALVQVVKDDVNPSNNGKILIWNFGVKVHKKLDMLMNPQKYEDDEALASLGVTPEKGFPFDPFSAKLFHVKVINVGGYNNYDECKFIDKETPIMMDGKFAKPEEVNTDEYRTKLLAYLKEASPDLSKQFYKPWDAATTEHVHSAIRNTIQSKSVVQSLLGANASVPDKVSDPLSAGKSPKIPDTTPLEMEEVGDELDLDLGDSELFDDIGL